MEQVSFKNLLRQLKKQSSKAYTCCEVCSKDVTDLIHIKCNVCQHLHFCVPCYTTGHHTAGLRHSFTVRDPHHFPLFTHDWEAREELRLIDGLLKYGYGNWNAVARTFKGRRTAAECENHYKQVYHRRSIEELERLPVLSRLSKAGYIEERTGCRLPEYKEEPSVFQNDHPPLPTDGHPLNGLPGYMPYRQDFEVEYENDIEKCLADLEFYEDDRMEDQRIKLQQLHVYNQVLDAREERKEFAINRWATEQGVERSFKKNPVHANIYAGLKPYARFLDSKKFYKLCKEMIKEHELKTHLEELLEAHQSNITTEREFQEFVAMKRGRQADPFYAERGFFYKKAEREKREILNNTHEGPGLVEKLCGDMHITLPLYTELKDRISEQFEGKNNIKPDELSPNVLPDQSPQTFDFIVKVRKFA